MYYLSIYLYADLFHKGFEEEVFGMNIIATENIVYAFFHLGHLKESAVPRVSCFMCRKKNIIT